VERFLEGIHAGVLYVNRRAGATTGAWPACSPSAAGKARARPARPDWAGTTWPSSCASRATRWWTETGRRAGSRAARRARASGCASAQARRSLRLALVRAYTPLCTSHNPIHSSRSGRAGRPSSMRHSREPARRPTRRDPAFGAPPGDRDPRSAGPPARGVRPRLDLAEPPARLPFVPVRGEGATVTDIDASVPRFRAASL